MRRFSVLIFCILLSQGIWAQKNLLTLDLFTRQSGIVYKNSNGQPLAYSKRPALGWSFGYGYSLYNGIILLESKMGFTRIESHYSNSVINTGVSLDFIQPSVMASFVIPTGKIKFKIGMGGNAGYLVGGHQIHNGAHKDVITENIYKRTEYAVQLEAGILLKPSDKIHFQLMYQYRYGLSNMEKNTSQSTKTIANGIQAGLLFPF